VDYTIADDQTEAQSRRPISPSAPEDLLTAAAQLVLGEIENLRKFESEPTASVDLLPG
jgi:hypothetical protein